MKLVHPELTQQIVFEKFDVCEWIIESPPLFLKYVRELCDQSAGGEGGFVLSHEGKELDIPRYMEVIIDPLNVNINGRKVLTKLYSDLEKLAHGEIMFLETQEVMGNLFRYFGNLEQESPYMLSTGDTIELSALFKALDVKLADNSDNYLEYLNQYMKVTAELLGKRLTVFINVRSYIEDELLQLLIENARYNEISLLFIEGSQKDLLRETKRYIIDSDGCEI